MILPGRGAPPRRAQGRRAHGARRRRPKAATDTFVKNLKALEKVNAAHPAVEGLEHAKYMRDKVIPAMDATREAADVLERIVADDLWPLPKYSEMLFIK